jgi:hypothetical protein
MNTPNKSPFKFLDSYDKDDRDIFFGRRQETDELYNRIFETNLVLLYGASGTGKTSLINCGLANQFESSDWFPVFVRRKDNFMKSWRDEIQKLALTKKPEEASFREIIHSLYLDYFKPIYLIFDQFEEIFIIGSKEEQHQFFEQLAQLLHANLQCKFIISMREEYLAHLSGYELLIPELFDNRLRVEKMNQKNLKEVIEGTTKAFQIQLSNKQKIIENIIEKLKDKNQEIDLANLQVYLDRLYRLDCERKGAEQRPTRFDEELIEKTGDLEDVMSMFLDEQISLLENELSEMGIQQKGIPLDILFTLVTDNGTKQPADVNDIKRQLKRLKGVQPEVVDYCLQRLREMRILRQLSE